MRRILITTLTFCLLTASQSWGWFQTCSLDASGYKYSMFYGYPNTCPAQCYQSCYEAYCFTNGTTCPWPQGSGPTGGYNYWYRKNGSWGCYTDYYKFDGTCTYHCNSPATAAFTDDPLAIGTKVKATHFTEMRSAIDAKRTEATLAPYPWAEAIAPGVKVKKQHVDELRSAIADVYTACGPYVVSPQTPTWAETITAGSTTPKKSHIDEIRGWIKSAP